MWPDCHSWRIFRVFSCSNAELLCWRVRTSVGHLYLTCLRSKLLSLQRVWSCGMLPLLMVDAWTNFGPGRNPQFHPWIIFSEPEDSDTATRLLDTQSCKHEGCRVSCIVQDTFFWTSVMAQCYSHQIVMASFCSIQTLWAVSAHSHAEANSEQKWGGRWCYKLYWNRPGERHKRLKNVACAADESSYPEFWEIGKGRQIHQVCSVLHPVFWVV